MSDGRFSRARVTGLSGRRSPHAKTAAEAFSPRLHPGGAEWIHPIPGGPRPCRILPLPRLFPIVVRRVHARRTRAHLNTEAAMLEEKYTGNGKVLLLAGGDRIYTDLAARFVRSERELEDIVASPYSRQIVKNILSSGHRAALEFDFFLFGVEGYSRVTEAQLVRKRLASYLIKSGRAELNGKRRFSVVYPREVAEFSAPVTLPGGGTATLSGRDLADLTRQWYEAGLEAGLSEENLRYLKPQATEFKAIIGMNAHALLDWFAIRCCRNAQQEIRDLAWKMLRLCRQAAPDLFEGAGPNCVQLGYCPENSLQNARCKGRIITKDEAMAVLREHGRRESSPRDDEFEQE